MADGNGLILICMKFSPPTSHLFTLQRERGEEGGRFPCNNAWHAPRKLMAPTSRFPDWKIATDCMRWTDDGSLRQESPRPAGPEIFCNKWRHKFLRRRPQRCSSLKEKFGKLTFGKRCTASVHFRSRAIGGSSSNTAIGISAFCPEGKRCVKFRRPHPQQV